MLRVPSACSAESFGTKLQSEVGQENELANVNQLKKLKTCAKKQNLEAMS